MTTGGVLVLLFLLGVAALSVTTLVIAVRGGRGPADPPRSHPGDGGWPQPRGVVHRAVPALAPGPGREPAPREPAPAFVPRAAR
ncbi:hypothetical protein SAMN03159343_0720 [Klenkia marina]|uniref:Uncharacterized protein n=1 Tax=Klenkia marina TaxID=1960309 RepID=A0A1G4XG30_9ACTN|nr:hypothetical protein [Klenkia marina]SCX39628.1 hypothetical protein SAMN03159343_0720 [Klenkia marina]